MKKIYIMLLCFLTGGISMQAQVNNGLKARFPFSGNTADISGENNNGQIVGNVTPVPDRFNYANCAYSFPGDMAAFIEIPLNGDFQFDPNTGSFTISLWYRGGSMNGGDREILWGKMNVSNDADYHLGLYDLNKLLFHVWEPDSIAPWPNADTAWHHVVAVYDSARYLLYKDNVLIASDLTQQSPMASPTENIVIGRNFEGQIDDISYYDRALTLAEIDTLFQAQSSCATMGVGSIGRSRDLNLYPNPATDNLYLDLREIDDDMSIVICNRLGQVLTRIQHVSSEKITIDTRGYAPGTYVIRITGKNGDQYSGLFQKIK